MKEGLVISTFKKACQNPSVKEGLIIHSDGGVQYGGNIFRKLILDKKVIQSMNCVKKQELKGKRF